MPKTILRQRKQKKSQIKENRNDGKDSNAYELLPRSATEREERRYEITEKLKRQRENGVVSAKKQKRLNKYIVCLF